MSCRTGLRSSPLANPQPRQPKKKDAPRLRAEPERLELNQAILFRLIPKERQSLAKNFLPCGGNRAPYRESGGDLWGHGDEAFHCHATLEANRSKRGEHLV